MNSLILKRELFQKYCTDILSAVDSNELSILTETLELKTLNNTLVMSVTNREYYAKVIIPIENVLQLQATVNANLFLRLIAQISTPEIELSITDNFLVVKGNGLYKLPLIFDGDSLLELPEININNVTATFELDSEILLSILNYNSKQLSIGTISKPVQKLYYVDGKGAVTFTSGACVNSFELPENIRILLNGRLVKLFKLFKGKGVKFTLGYDNLTDDIIQTKVRFESSDISITAILSCDDTMLNSVPVEAIRGRASAYYPYTVNLSKDALLKTISRLMLFSGSASKELVSYSTFEFEKDKVTIYDSKKENKEILNYNNENSNIEETYKTIVDLAELKGVLESCSEQYVNINFGDTEALILTRGHVVNIIPEIHDL